MSAFRSTNKKPENSSYSPSKTNSSGGTQQKRDSPQKSEMNRPPIVASRSHTSSMNSRTAQAEPSSPVSRPPIVRPMVGRSSSESSTSSSHADRVSSSRPTMMEFGIIVSIKETFGFIQPLQGEEQIYFSERELYRGIAIGDEVSFFKRTSSKGYHAERVNLVNISSKEYIRDLTAIVVREADSLLHRATPGLVELSEESRRTQVLTSPRISPIIQAYGPLPSIPFFIEDILTANNGKGSKKIFKGDEISCSLSFIAGTPYLRASAMNFVRGKRDRLLSEQIQKMLDAGVKRERGIIDTIKNDEYGFIRPVERAEQIYFRVDDVIEENKKLEEGMEVEFFVIAESIKGKLSDRAVHLSPLPSGTVQFEVTIAENMIGYVNEESIATPHEKPGNVKLVDEIMKSDGSGTLSTIQLWQRCLPDDLNLRVGDRLRFDIQHYRPENLYFARSVHIESYQKLSREYGNICSIKEYGFGFIRSHIREMDLYFRTAEVRDGDTGQLIPEGSLQQDMVLCYDVLIDDATNFKGIHTSSSSSKLKAIRVQTVSQADQKVGLPSMIEDLRVSLLEHDIRGMVMKDAVNKRDSQPGHIQISSDDHRTIMQKPVYHAPELKLHIQEFIDNPVLSEVIIKYLAPGQRKAYHDLLDECYPDIIIHESIELSKDSFNISDPSKGRALRIIKASPSTTTSAAHAVANKPKKVLSKAQVNGTDDMVVFFQKHDVNEIYGPITKDLTVCFDLYVDKRTMKRVAKNVRLTDDPILEDAHDDAHVDDKTSTSYDKKCYGVIDSIVGVRSGRFGFIRRLPTDEKLFWHSSAIDNDDGKVIIDYDSIVENQEISFDLRRRGGMRCAVNIKLLPAQSLMREEMVDGICTAMIVDATSAVLCDVHHCASYMKNMWDYDRLSLSYNKDMVSSMLMSESSSSTEIKYYPAIPRIPIDMMTDNISCELVIGSFISCHIQRNAALSRQPVALSNISTLPSSDYPIIRRVQGIINRVKIKAEVLLSELTGQQPVPAMTSADPWHGLEFCEIQSTGKKSSEMNGDADASSTASSSQDMMMYYCLQAEVLAKPDPITATASSREGAQVGDKVEFFPSPSHRLALHPVLVPKISYRRGASEMKANQAASGKITGVQGIVMAKGPPTDAAVGFDAGWRDVVDVSTLPWSHLFQS